MARAVQINTVTQRADDSIWKKIDNGTWKQLQDGHNHASLGKPARSAGGAAGAQPKGEWDKLRERYDLDGHLPDPSVAPEHVEIDTEGDIDTKPVLRWRDATGRVRKSYTRTFHLQRSYALHKACKEHSDAIFAAMDKAEELVKSGDDGAATVYAALLTGHRPKVFQSVTPDRVRVYRGEQLEKSFVDEMIEKADTRDPKHPNRVHIMYDHPTQGAAVSSFYDVTLSDHIARGGSFGDPSAVMDALGMSGIDFGVVRHHANLRMAADNLSKTPYPEYGIDFESWNAGTMAVVGGMSAGIAAHYGHGEAPRGMSFVPVSATVATVDELGGGRYWPGTFPERKPYVEKLAEDAAPLESGRGDASAELGEVDDFAELDAELDAALEDPQAQKKASLLESILPDVNVDDLVLQVEAPLEKGDINWTPPEGVRAACRAGLKLKEQGYGGAGLRPATVAWARKLAAGKPITPAKARKMNAWFARHSRGSSAAGLSDKTSPAWVAWQLWGGNAGKAWSAKLVRQMDARKSASHEVQQCESSRSEARKSSTELSDTPSPTPTPIEPSSSTPTMREPNSRTPTRSPGASSNQGILSRPTDPLLAKAREVFAESVLACLRGNLPPMTVVEAARCVLLDDPQGVFDVMLKAVAPGQQRGAPEGMVKPDKDGKLVQKRDGEWYRFKDDPEEVTVERLREKLKLLKEKGGDPAEIQRLEHKLKELSARASAPKKSLYESWKQNKLEASWSAVYGYCKYMGYTRAEQLLYAVAAEDTPVSVAQHTKELVKAWGLPGIDQRLEVGRGS